MPQYPTTSVSTEANAPLHSATLISAKWKSEPPHEKKFWNDLAEQEKRNHKQKYPDYKYRVRKPQAKKKQGKQTAGIAGFETDWSPQDHASA